MPFHVEVRSGLQTARAFNLEPAELEARVLAPWRLNRAFELGDQTWEPEAADLTVIEGRELRPDELAMGRGWGSAKRRGDDVTGRVLAGDGPSAPASSPSMEDFKRAVLTQCGSGRIGLHQVVWLASGRHPGARASDRLALAEQAVWELLHQGALRLLDAHGTVESGGWQDVLLAWGSWAAADGSPAVQIERA